MAVFEDELRTTRPVSPEPTRSRRLNPGGVVSGSHRRGAL